MVAVYPVPSPASCPAGFVPPDTKSCHQAKGQTRTVSGEEDGGRRRAVIPRRQRADASPKSPCFRRSCPERQAGPHPRPEWCMCVEAPTHRAGGRHSGVGRAHCFGGAYGLWGRGGKQDQWVSHACLHVTLHYVNFNADENSKYEQGLTITKLEKNVTHPQFKIE